MLLVQCIAVSSSCVRCSWIRQRWDGRKPITFRRVLGTLRHRSMFAAMPSMLFLPWRFRGSLLHPAKIHPEFRRVPHPSYLDWNHRPRALLLEEAVSRLQQKSLPSPHHLRNRRLHARGSIKVQGAFQRVGALQLNVRARHTVLKIGQGNNSLCHVKAALHLRADAVCIGILDTPRLPLPPKAQLLDAILNLLTREMSIIQLE